MSRRQLREQEVLEELIVHMRGVVVPCHRCGVAFTPDDVKSGNIENEHLHEHALDGPDDPINRRFSHKPCHDLVTNGTPVTTAGSSKHRIAKTRGTRVEKFIPVKRPLDEPREPRRRWR
jgi:hypothetical protein